VVLAAVTQNGRALKYASEELKGDREVVLLAVTQDGFMLYHASEELKRDREVVLAALAQHELALDFVSAELLELQEDREVLLGEAQALRSLGLGAKAAR